MKKLLTVLALVLTLSLATMAASGAAPAATDSATAKTDVTVNPDDLKKLVTTLESDTGRADFIANLKTLIDTQTKTETAAPAEDIPPPLTKALGLDTFTTRVIDRYQAFLVRNDFKGSTVGRVILTAILLLIGALATFLTRRGATKMVYWFDRAVKWMDLPVSRMNLYARVLRSVVTVGFMGLMLYTLTLIWDFSADHNPFEAHWFRTVIGLMVNIGFVIVLATVAWEAINAVLQMIFKRVDGSNSTRARTILPIVRNIVFLVFTVLFTLTVLSEIGINVTPLLAGAGVIGVAIGFGAQTMVKDFLSGFTLILEDVMRVGDVIKVADLAGAVEKITLRKVQVRGGNGTVYTIPFSAITVVQNLTKDFSTFEFAYSVPFDTDPQRVFDELKKVGDEMQADPAFGINILEPIDIWGVDGFTDNGMVIKGKIKTVAGKHWGVQREFNRRKALAFSKAGIPNVAVPTSYQITEVAPLQPKPAADHPA